MHDAHRKGEERTLGHGTHQGGEAEAKRGDRTQGEEHACPTERHRAGTGQAQPPLHHQPQRQVTVLARTDQGRASEKQGDASEAIDELHHGHAGETARCGSRQVAYIWHR